MRLSSWYKIIGLCVLLIPVYDRLWAQSQNYGFPEWPLVLRHQNNQDQISVKNQVVDFKKSIPTTANPNIQAPSVNYINSTSKSFGPSAPAFYSACGRLAFYCVHTGLYLNSNGGNNGKELKIIAPDGTELTTAQNRMDCSPMDNEIQVIPMPDTKDTWMIIYNKNQNTGYVYSPLMYSVVTFQNGQLNFLSKDVEIKIFANGSSTVFNYGKAVSKLITGGGPSRRYLYVRRDLDTIINNTTFHFISFMQFKITANKIEKSANFVTNSVPDIYFTNFITNLDVNTPVELNETGNKVKLANVLYAFDLGRTSAVLLMEFTDHEKFGTSSGFEYTRVNCEDLAIQFSEDVSDGTGYYNLNGNATYKRPKDFELSTTAKYLARFPTKIAQLEFSPNGIFLYLAGGGYYSNNINTFTYNTYLAQVDLRTKFSFSINGNSIPTYITRIAVQDADSDPSPNPNAQSTGSGCTYNSATDECYRGFHGVGVLEKGINNKIYFTKYNSNKLYCIERPDEAFQNISLKPMEIMENGLYNVTLLPFTQASTLKANVLALPDAIDQESYVDFNMDCPPCCNNLQVTTTPAMAENDFCAGKSISFSANCPNMANQQNALTYSWDFGDLSVSNQPNPTHQYLTPGTYTVTVLVSSPTCPVTRGTIIVNITVCTVCCENPQVLIGTSDPCVGKPVYMKVTCADKPSSAVTYTWHLPGVDQTTSNAEFSYIFPNAGTFNISVDINVNGCTLKTIPYTITISQDCISPCQECIGTFAPEPGEYMLSFWVREDQPQMVYSYTSGVEIKFLNNFSQPLGTPVSIFASPQLNSLIIDGWQKVEARFTVPQSASKMVMALVNNANGQNIDAYFDDIRIHPFNASYKSFVYDPIHLRLMAELDENNYATFYEYDEEGKLIRVKKETEKGIKTIQENRDNIKK